MVVAKKTLSFDGGLTVVVDKNSELPIQVNDPFEPLM
jgi:hypothetical protein